VLPRLHPGAAPARLPAPSDDVYRYESGGGAFVRELTVNAAGFVTHYPDFFEPAQG